MMLTDAEREAGLDVPLPANERILWQAKPDARALTRSIFHLRGLAVYCGAAALVVLIAAAQSRPIGQAIAETTLLVPFFAVAYGLLALLGRASARATTYTITNRRVILHIGIAYEMTVSVPLSAIVNAGFRRLPDGRGEIALKVKPGSDILYLALWPHARPGFFTTPQPMLRGVRDAETVCDLLGEALIAFNAGGRHVSERPASGDAVVPMREAIAA